MATQVPVNLVHGGGSLTPLQIKRALCKAFRAAVADYCSAPVGQRGAFNDKYFDHLRNTQPHGAALAANITREVPVLAARAGSGAVGGTAQALASASNPAAQAVHGAHMAALGASPFAGAAAGAVQTGAFAGVTGLFGGGVRSCFAIGRLFATTGRAIFGQLAAAGLRLRFPDGMIGNQIIEIKGPADSFRPGQKADYDALSKPNPTMVVDCKSCGASCKNGPSLAGGWSKNKGCP